MFLISSCSFRVPIIDNMHGGELIINESESVFRIFAEDSKTMNPCANIPESLSDAMEIIYEPLYDFDEALNPIPVLAKDTAFIGDNKYKIKLKKDVKWHDGSAFGAKDVVHSIDLLKSERNNYSKEIKKIADAEFVADNEVIITTSEPVFNFTGLLSFPIVKAGIQLYAEVAPVGTGPYKFSKKKGNEYTFVKNENWHMGEATDKTITLTLMKDKESAVYAFEANEADLISSRITDLTNNTLRGNIFTHSYLSNRLTFLGMNTSEGILSSPEIRSAISYLINKDELVKKHIYGKGKAVDVPIYPKAWFYNEQDDNIEVNSDGAYLEKLLNQDGWYKKNGLYTKDYESYASELTLSILVNKENSERKAIAEDIANRLGKFGVTVKVKTSSYEEYTSRINSGDYSMFIGEVEMDKNMDPSSLVERGNYFFYNSEEMDMVLEKMAHDEDLKKACSDFSAVFLKDTPFVPLFFREEALITSSSLSGVGTPNYYRIYKNIENWYFTRKVELENNG